MTHFPFPFTVAGSGRTLRPTTDVHIRELIEALLFTSQGERVNRPDLGSGVLQLVFEPAGEELVAATEYRVQGALQQWLGDLVQVEGVRISVEESTVSVEVEYVVRRNEARQIATFSREV